MFRWPSSSRRHEEELAELLQARAAQLIGAEGKTRPEAEYLAICSIVDDLQRRPRPIARAQAFITLMTTRYADHRDEIMIYMAWKSDVIEIGPDRRKAMLGRHGPWSEG